MSALHKNNTNSKLNLMSVNQSKQWKRNNSTNLKNTKFMDKRAKSNLSHLQNVTSSITYETTQMTENEQQ